MAVLWSLATLLCAVADNYEQMLAGRLLVGVGEAAYGSVGIAVVVSVFPKRLRATLSAAFMAGGLLGQVLGVGIGGAVAAAHGWRMAFLAIALSGLALAVLYPMLVGERRLGASPPTQAGHAALRAQAGRSRRSAACSPGGRSNAPISAAACSCSSPAPCRPGCRPISTAIMTCRSTSAASLAALFLAICGIGMVVCGLISDRLFSRPEQRVDLAVGYSLACAVLA